MYIFIYREIKYKVGYDIIYILICLYTIYVYIYYPTFYDTVRRDGWTRRLSETVSEPRAHKCAQLPDSSRHVVAPPIISYKRLV